MYKMFYSKKKYEYHCSDINKTYLSKHIDYVNSNNTATLASNSIINNTATLASHEAYTNETNETKRTLVFSPSFCGKSSLVLNKLKIISWDNPEKQIKI